MTDFTALPDGKTHATEIDFSDTEDEARIFSFDKLNSVSTESPEETIRRMLSSYDLGRKLRQLRMRKKIALVDLGRHTGLSASMLSQLENGKLVPTLPTLARIAMVFDVGLDHFFDHAKRRGLFAIVRAGERIRFPDRHDSPKPAFFFECLAFSTQDKSMQAYLAEFPKRNPREVPEHMHDGAEFVHIIEGSLALQYDEEEHILDQGDSVYFDSSGPHSYRGLSDLPSKALVITTLPRA